MSTARLLGWLVFLYVALIGLRYLLGARHYFTCALRLVKAWATSPDLLTPGQLRVLQVFDSDLAAAGFTHLGYAHYSSILTHHAAPQTLSVFVNTAIPAYAFVRRSGAPEDGHSAVLSLTTELPDGSALESVNSPLAKLLAPPSTLRVEDYPGVAVSEIVSRHAAQVDALRGGAPVRAGASLDEALDYLTRQVRQLRDAWRQRGWVVPSADPQLDSFTVRGAFALTNYSLRVARGSGARAPQSTSSAASEEARALRLEAEVDAVLSVAESPQRAPGTPRALIALVAATAIGSFAAMSLLWNPLVAVLILTVVAFHEAGHAIAMRWVGYRDVQVFFVPLIGALTIGNTSTATVRGQIAMLLAGPVPGLWAAVALLAIDQAIGPVWLLRATAVAFLVINALNLLPVTPFDGGRVFELLSRPESLWRPAIHAASIAGLMLLGVVLSDSVIIGLAIIWAIVLPRQWLAYRLRYAVARALTDRDDYPGVVRTALEVLASPPFGKWRSLVRQSTARQLAKQFSQPQPTSADRAWGVAGYVIAWVPFVIAAVLWRA
ncbi:MAG TPA: hypothetical protein VH814_13385 [Steroidobacteraceae bacterium]